MQAIEVVVTETTLATVLPPKSEFAEEFKAYWVALEEIRATREELVSAASQEDDKQALAKFLDQRQRQVSATYLSGRNSIDYLAARR